MPPDALRTAHAHLLAGRFAAALTAVAPLRATPPGALLHALALAGSGDVRGAAPLLLAIARANPAHRHPVLDLVPLLPPDAAAAHLRAAIALRPDPALLSALGTALAETGLMADAIDAFRQAAELAPAGAANWSNLGKALAAMADFAGAAAAFETARRLAPDDTQIAFNAAIALLKSGQHAAGWAALDVRHRLPGRPPPLPGPRLRDLHVAGRTVLLRHEEGFGDTIQFIRFAAPLAARGARVLAAVPAPLRRLVATATGVAGVCGTEDRPAYDIWAPMLDVPGLFDGVPPPFAPYLRAEGAGPGLPPSRRIGVVWAGDPRGLLDRQRSIPIERLAPLAARRDIVWVSLQKDRPAPSWMTDPMGAVRDFADTAAIVAQLDAVVSVDTAVAHLAGALGKPVLLLDRFDACWRWGTGRTDSPWYPSLRIVRQPSPGDWASAVEALLPLLP